MNLFDIFKKFAIPKIYRHTQNYVPNDIPLICAGENASDMGFEFLIHNFDFNQLKGKIHVRKRAFPQIMQTILGIRHAFKSLKNNPIAPQPTISNAELDALQNFAKKIGVNKIGYTTLPSNMIFKNQATLFPNVIVIIKEMPQDAINLAPHGKTFHMIMRTYNRMGKQANKIADYLRKHGFAAQAGPALGGLSIYPVLARNANLGWIGKHGLLITPEFGPRQRIAVIYANISNLPVPGPNPHEWIAKYCARCDRCIRTCPGAAILAEPRSNPNGTMTHIDVLKCFPSFTNYGCSVCLKECSFNQSSYEQLKKTVRD